MDQHNTLSKRSIIELVHQWGSSVVDSILDPTCHIFSITGVHGLIGYYTNKGCVVAFGDPVCSPADLPHLVDAFHAYCESQKKNVVYLVASESFAKWMQEKHECGLITFGKELFLNPGQDPQLNTGKKGISLRGKLRQAKKNGILIEEYHGGMPELEYKIQDVAHQWLKHRNGPQIYISRVRLFKEHLGKRCFYARQGDQLVASIILNRLHAKEGWALDRIMTIPTAPQGTSELLVVSAMETLAKEDCRFLSFGAVNGPTLGAITGFGKCASFLIHHGYKASLKIFNLHCRGKYWEKFQPQSTPSFLVFKNPRLGLYEIKGLRRALNVSFSNKT